ncbi:MAG: hypothetical protein SF066_09970 [Thermoanaerobaculia bacterium]|nr:hypothetical protein [Thermoanaerobaculia bacterium]
MNLGRIMVIVGLAGVAGLGYAAYQGWRGFGEDDIQAHVLAALVPLLVSVLAQSWICFYLVGTRRLLVTAAAARGQAVSDLLVHLAGRTLAPILVGLAAGFATFVLGASAYAGWAQPSWHVAMFVFAVVVQSWAAVASWRALGAVETTLGELEPESAR